jgi:CRISPR-associated protein Cas2
MSRRRVLVSYDIASDRRRSLVFRTLRNFGEHVQFSVFLCDLNQMERIRLVAELTEVIHHKEDTILLVDMGAAGEDLPERLLSIGKPVVPSTRTIVI